MGLSNMMEANPGVDTFLPKGGTVLNIPQQLILPDTVHEGIVINSAADLSAVTSGQVTDEKITFTTIQDNNFTGNPLGAPIDIQAITISGDDIGYGSETFAIWEGLPTAVEGSGFSYWDPMFDPEQKATTCYWGDSDCNKATYPIAPGQGVVINCAANLKISIEPPYSL